MSTATNPSDNYAVLFVGGGSSNHYWYYDSLKDLYSTITGQQYGLLPQNVYVLYADAGSTYFDKDVTASASDFLTTQGVDEFAREYGIEFSGAERRLLLSLFKKEEINDDQIGLIGQVKKKFNDGQDKCQLKIIGDKPGEKGGYLVYSQLVEHSDMSFATDAGSTLLPGTGPFLQNALTDLSSRVDDNDHVFVWTFDHGHFGDLRENPDIYLNLDGSPLPSGQGGDFARRDIGNQARLNGWGNDAIKNNELAQWISPVIDKSGYTTLVYNQCFSGGMLDASRPQLAAAANAYGMAASNAYEVSWGNGFAGAVTKALKDSNPTASELFSKAKKGDYAAADYSYADNDGLLTYQKEHPWAFGGSNGNFPVFAVGDVQHPLEQQGIDFQDSSEFAAEASLAQIDVSLAEDSSLDLQASLVDQFGPGVTVDAVTWPGYGSLEVVDGALIYTPMADFHGSDSFLLRYSTPSGTTEIRYSLEVSSVNDAPVASDTFVAVDSDKKRVKFSIDSQPGYLGDFDLDGDALRVTNYSNTGNGRLKKIGPTTFSYKPNSGFEGTDSFLYQITDGEAYSVAQVTLTVGGDAFLRDSFGFYEVRPDGSDPITNPLRAPDGSLLSDDSSAGWDIVAAEKDGDRYHLLLQGVGKKEGLYQVWTADESGQVFNRRKRWLSPDQLEEKTYGRPFEGFAGSNATVQSGSPITDVDGGIFASII